MIARYGRTEDGEGDDPDRAFMRILAETAEGGTP